MWKHQIKSPLYDVSISSDGSVIATSENSGLLFFDKEGNILWNSSTDNSNNLHQANNSNNNDNNSTNTTIAIFPTTYLAKTSADGNNILTGAIIEQEEENVTTTTTSPTIATTSSTSPPIGKEEQGRSVELRNKFGVPIWGALVKENHISSIDMQPSTPSFSSPQKQSSAAQAGASYIAIASYNESLPEMYKPSKVYLYERNEIIAGHYFPAKASNNNTLQSTNLDKKPNDNDSSTHTSFPATIGIGAVIAGIIAFITLRKFKKK